MAAEGKRMEVNASTSENMEGGNYPDSVNSSPRSRDTDTEYFGGNQRWDAVDPGGSGGGAATGAARVRLMCSCGGKILPRPHDNQLAYVGGDTRILAVERNIRFATMISRLSSLWGTGVSFKYQLPNEDLDALVSVTNDEDLENMMAEYDRLHKSGYKFSRLRLFVFPTTRTDTASSAPSSISSAIEESGKQWFVDALNNPPVNQASDATTKPDSAPGVSETSVWVNNMPDYLFGLEGQHGNAANVNAEEELKPSSEVKQNPANFSPDQAEKPANFAPRGFEDAPRRDPVPVSNPNMQKQEAYGNAPAVAAAAATQIPVQDFQKLNLRQQPPPVVAEVPPPPRQEETPRKMYAEPVRAPEVPASRPINPEPAYQIQPEYYLQEHHHQQQQLQQQQLQQQQQQHQPQAGGHMGHPPMSYFQVHDHSGVYLVPAGSHMMHQMPAMRPVAGQPAPAMQYYNPPIQRMPVPAPAVYDAPPPVTTVRASAVAQRQEDQYREQQVLQQQPPPPPMQQQPVLPLPKVAPAYGAPAPAGGMVYRAPAPMAPAGAVHPGEPAAYTYQQQQHVMYEPNQPRQMYYTQALNPTYQPVAAPSADVTPAPSEQVKQGRVPTQ